MNSIKLYKDSNDCLVLSGNTLTDSFIDELGYKPGTYILQWLGNYISNSNMIAHHYGDKGFFVTCNVSNSIIALILKKYREKGIIPEYIMFAELPDNRIVYIDI